MDLDIAVPRHAVDVVPGGQARVPVELTNRSPDDGWVRLSLAPSRAAAWMRLEPATVSLPAGGTEAVEAVVRPPAGTPATPTLLPYTIVAGDLRDGTPLARATGLVTLAAPEQLRATVRATVPRTATGRRVRLTLRLENPGGRRRTVTVRHRLSPAGGRVRVEPATVDLAPGGTATAHVEVRPPALAVGASVPYVVTLSCHDAAADPDAPPLAVVEETGQSPPRLSRAAAVSLTAALVLAAGAAVATGGLTLPGRGSAPAASDEIRVRAPYAQIDVFPRGNGDGRASAEAALARLTAAGMPVRLVDSRLSPDLADGQDGLYVLLQDGFAGVDEVSAYCERYRQLAPKCSVVA